MESNITIGTRFGSLTTTSIEINGAIECLCDCGEYTLVPAHNLLKNLQRSCGCIPYVPSTIKNYKHNLSKHPLYPRWYSKRREMIQEWRESFLMFYNWAMKNGWKEKEAEVPSPPAHSIFLCRKDSSLPYSPDNCFFGNAEDSALSNSNIIKVTLTIPETGILSETKSLSQWYYDPRLRGIIKVEYETACARIKRGWTPQKALFTPPMKSLPQSKEFQELLALKEQLIKAGLLPADKPKLTTKKRKKRL